ncbi:hypothetical protein LINPERPRIM_LOCUS30 [Linum perenne]
MSSICLTACSTTLSRPLAVLPPAAGKSFQYVIASVGVPSTDRGRLQVVRMAPEEVRFNNRNPFDMPIEWEKPRPASRPDIFHQFRPASTPLPVPLPFDPPLEYYEEDEEQNEHYGEEHPDQEESQWAR